MNTSLTDEKVDVLAKKIWDYHHMNQPLRKADAIFVLGSHDIRVAAYAAELFKQGYAPLLIFSGKSGRTTGKIFSKTEAETLADVAADHGVPRDKMLLEMQATNTGENIIFTRKLLEERGIDVQSFILVQKPYMERRTYATFMKQWPGKDFVVASPPFTYENYLADGHISREHFIDQLIGDLQRIKLYPAKGFQIEQDIPADVWDAQEQLVNAGFSGNLSL